MEKEKLLNAIRNREKYLVKEYLDDSIDYIIGGEGPWFTNSQFGGHIYLDGDLTNYEIIGEFENGDRILFDEVNLRDYFINDVDEEDVDFVFTVVRGKKLVRREVYQIIEEWFDRNQIDNVVYYGIDTMSIREYNPNHNIEFIYYKQDGDMYCATLANLEHFIRWNEECDDNFNNALALKR